MSTPDPVTEETVAPDTITEEVIGTALNEEALNAIDDTPEDGGEQPEAKPKPDEKPKDDKPAKTRVSAMPDGTYVIRNPDGTELKLSEEQASGLIRKRIDREVYKRHEAEREAERLKAELEAAKTAPTKPDDATAQKPDPDDPRPSWENQDWDSMDAYQDALYDWRRRQETRSPAPKAPDTEAPGDQGSPDFASWRSKAAEVLETGRKNYNDWDTVVTNNQDAPFDGAFTNFIFTEADDAAAVLYELGQNTDEAKAMYAYIAAGDVKKAARALGKLEARISTGEKPELDPDGSAPLSQDETDTTTRSRAPITPPITPLTTSRGAGISTHKDPEKMSQKEYERWRAAGGGN